jgi:hypothetical protein
MNAIVEALNKQEKESDNACHWRLAELCKMAALEITTKAAELADLKAARAMQDESLVVLPRHMMNSIEEKLKAQAAEIERLTEKVRYAYVQIEALEAK